jgi:hypothetical protein
MKHRCSYDDVIARLVEVIGNTTPLMTNTESASARAESAPSGAEPLHLALKAISMRQGTL